MHDIQTDSPFRRGWQRMLDGERRWGSIDVQPDRFGMTRYRLVVFPPGITEAERRRIRLARGWPLWGALVWVCCEVWLSQVTGPWTALGLSSAAYIGLGVFVMAMAGAQRTQVKSMAVTISATYHDAKSTATRDKLGKLAITLMEADERLGRGQISAADHEMTWWRVYDDMGSSQRPAAA